MNKVEVTMSKSNSGIEGGDILISKSTGQASIVAMDTQTRTGLESGDEHGLEATSNIYRDYHVIRKAKITIEEL